MENESITSLTREEVERIAVLAHLSLSDAEVALYREQLSVILAHAARLQAVDAGGTLPPAAVGRRPVLREDEPGATLSREEALFNGPDCDAGCFRVPPVKAME
ncbi:MAG: Asp-tRNA(Asn)/Glu-tRNA(Gln) amidotransferase subunit GatC [Anaerolineae bacterium]|nr:Asp-tRNA(Asn)/Glu-tRNA(Gln) amidotransferase subunit GatC [Anaerolineae bacterium]